MSSYFIMFLIVSTLLVWDIFHFASLLEQKRNNPIAILFGGGFLRLRLMYAGETACVVLSRRDVSPAYRGGGGSPFEIKLIYTPFHFERVANEIFYTRWVCAWVCAVATPFGSHDIVGRAWT